MSNKNALPKVVNNPKKNYPNKDTKPKRVFTLSQSLAYAIKGGKVVKAKQEELLEAIKSDKELCNYTDQNGTEFASLDNISNLTGLDKGTVIIVQKFNIYQSKTEYKTVLTWAPTNIKDLYKAIGYDPEDGSVSLTKSDVPSFLGKNIIAAVENFDLGRDDMAILFKSMYIDSEFKLGRSTYYKVYVQQNKKQASFKLKTLKASRDFNISPKINSKDEEEEVSE